MSTLKGQLLDIIFPRRCLGCNIILGEEISSYVCKGCLKTITFKNDFACAFCKSPVKNGKTCPYCIKNHFLDRLLVATSYENQLVEKILKTMKYRFVASLAKDISCFMIRYLNKRLVARLGFNKVSTMVVPVPLHFRRLNWRGFNQAEVMAEKICDFFGWPIMAKDLQRRYNRKPQADVADKFLRIENAENLFEFQDRKAIAGRIILLIDDISTTGSTLNDCARALKGAGAKEVIGFVFARNKT